MTTTDAREMERYHRVSASHRLHSLNDAIRYLCDYVIEGAANAAFMGDNCLVIGKADRFARIALETSGTFEHWTTLSVSIFVNDQIVTRYAVRFDRMANAPGRAEFCNPRLDDGGNIWRSSGAGLEWYNWRPVAEAIGAEVGKICEFHKCN